MVFSRYGCSPSGRLLDNMYSECSLSNVGVPLAWHR